jgi:hypothetical protein
MRLVASLIAVAFALTGCGDDTKAPKLEAAPAKVEASAPKTEAAPAKLEASAPKLEAAVPAKDAAVKVQ